MLEKDLFQMKLNSDVMYGEDKMQNRRATIHSFLRGFQ